MAFSLLHSLCDQGQFLLQATRYLEAERMLAYAEAVALSAGDFESLSRLYLPLLESRRQRRQKCADGAMQLCHLALTADARLPEISELVARHRAGQFVYAAYDDLTPSLSLRARIAAEGLYAEAFIAAVRPTAAGPRVCLYATPDATSPLVLEPGAIPGNAGRSSSSSPATGWWESLAAPALAAAEGETEGRRKLLALRNVIEIDYANEPAHQALARLARGMA